MWRYAKCLNINILFESLPQTTKHTILQTRAYQSHTITRALTSDTTMDWGLRDQELGNTSATVEEHTLRYPIHPPDMVFGEAWLACLVDNKFVFDAEKMLLSVECILHTTNRHHIFFLDLKQALYTMWPVREFLVCDSDYPDTVGALYPSSKEIWLRHENIQSKCVVYLP